MSVCNASPNKSISKSRSRKRKVRPSLQKASGSLSELVKSIGAEKFALVCIDPAKRRSEWMMADYFGNILIQPQTLEHEAGAFAAAIELVRQVQQRQALTQVLVTVERTGNYHRHAKLAFTAAGFEVRVVHPFATKQFRLIAHPGNKTDQTDLQAQHTAAIAGFGLREPISQPVYERLQLLVRHRRSLVEKKSAIACQVQDHLHLSLPGLAELFADLFVHAAGLWIARSFATPAEIVALGALGLSQQLRAQGIRFQRATVEKVLAWAEATSRLGQLGDSQLRQEILSDLLDCYAQLDQQIQRTEAKIARFLAKTPHIRLLSIVGINVVSAADLAAEMGPIINYLNANAITGRAGLYPSRYQSDQTDLANGPLVRQANRRLRCALMRIADNLCKFNSYFHGQALVMHSRQVDPRAIRVKVAKHFTRLAYALLAGDAPLRHACSRTPDSIIDKLREFHAAHDTPLDVVLADLESATLELQPKMRGHEAQLLSEILQQQTSSSRGPKRIGELLTTVLARLLALPLPHPGEPSSIEPKPVSLELED